jgi:hypothetical protein
MIQHGGRGNFRIDAKITNPNDFAGCRQEVGGN